ncbi:glutathione S-transferase family protein [Croceicoccus ponticola]|uniref:Glutathione S-transferase family protein n=1 Tax=Croceicoccus ponticola TaxID=2217664 RepID=A0A437GVQ8_9SPHN|nr:glutathione S-transferase family protein [Croceicoccus ponticola]RVQ65965.1 glutathione S-transferase family protein [Croceicoccus ponticola]
MPIDPNAPLVLTAYRWVPSFVHGLVRDVRVRWACEEAGLAYAEDLIDVRHKPDGYEAVQPWKQVPALRDGDVRYFESGAILLHIAEKDARLLPPAGQARADTMSWFIAALNSVDPGAIELNNVNFFSRGQDWAEQRMPSLIEGLAKKLEPVAHRLAQRDWLAGEFSIADVLMIHVLMAIDSASDLISSQPTLAAYVERGKARPAWQQALADQLAAFERNTPKEN